MRKWERSKPRTQFCVRREAAAGRARAQHPRAVQGHRTAGVDEATAGDARASGRHAQNAEG